MAEKIFISYNHNDKVLIDTVARRLELEFGRNNIFYDAWSLQPGDSIIGSMDAGLSEFTTFFFFVSPASLNSNMVKLEWQVALNRAINNNLKFVAVRITDCTMPTILTDKLYIDLYGDGLDSAIEKMRCVIKGENSYTPLDDIQNLQAFIKQVDINHFDITVKATHFVVHNPIIAIGLTLPAEQFKVEPTSEGMVISGRDIIVVNDGTEFTAARYELCRALVPGQPFLLKLQLEGNTTPPTIAFFNATEKNAIGQSVYRHFPCFRV